MHKLRHCTCSIAILSTATARVHCTSFLCFLLLPLPAPHADPGKQRVRACGNKRTQFQKKCVQDYSNDFRCA